MARDTSEKACILFFGQTGIGKCDAHDPSRRTVASALAAECAAAARLTGDDPGDLWQAFDFEDYLMPGKSVREFIPEHRPRRQIAWDRACRRLAADVESSSAAVVGVFLHGYYWNRGELFNHVNLAELSRLKPTLTVTLVDDAYDIHSRIQRHEDEFTIGSSSLRLSQVLNWRWTEIGLADLVARNVRSDRPIEHFLVNAKHPPEMLYRLLFDRARLPVYASFPITKVRFESEQGISLEQRDELRDEINQFRRKLRERNFVVFDPVTIDELRFDTQGELLSRWAIEDYEPMVPRETDLHDRTMTEILDPILQQTLLEEIKLQIVPRDLRMIDGAAAVVTYRPCAFDQQHSHGTAEELRYGQSNQKRIVVVHDPKFDGAYFGTDGPFDHPVRPAVYDRLDAALHDLDEYQARREEVVDAGREPRIWTDEAGVLFSPRSEA
jgi:hypothetical protein